MSTLSNNVGSQTVAGNRKTYLWWHVDVNKAPAIWKFVGIPTEVFQLR
jgi:hypothetical protein